MLQNPEQYPALRLKESVIAKKKKQLEGEGHSESAGPDSQDNRLTWEYFDVKEYLDKTRIEPGRDAYARNKFNQAASDRIKMNRDVPDTRHPRWVRVIVFLLIAMQCKLCCFS